ncbi:hypothetical protein B7486_04810 [cyanobacterium TDX16]|nr:hypothetical protein B7486_04810 [cyanobacterium TDX16]
MHGGDAVSTRTAIPESRTRTLGAPLDPLLAAPSITTGFSQTPLPQIGRGHCVAVLAVHHVHPGGQVLTGGAEKYVCDAVEALLSVGARVHVGYSGVSVYGDLLDRHAPDALTVEHVGWIDDQLSGDNQLGLMRHRERRRWLRATHADTLFVVQQASGAAFFASLVAARSLGLRVVSSIRQMAPTAAQRRHPTSRIAAMLRPSIRRRALPARCCDTLIFNSETVARDYFHSFAFPENRARIILNGHRLLPAAAKRRRNLEPVLGVVGRVSKEKGCDIVLTAFGQIAKTDRHARLVFFGDGPLVPALQADAVSLGIADRVSFQGYVADRDRVYSDIDICIQASRRESMANTVIEAMSRGIPCVVSDVGGLPEAVRHEETGLVFADGNVEQCAEAILELSMNERKWSAFSTASAAHARRVFSWERFAAQTTRAILG